MVSTHGDEITPAEWRLTLSIARAVVSVVTQEDGMASDNPSSTEYHVVGVVKQKLLFHNRPKPIVSKKFLPPAK